MDSLGYCYGGTKPFTRRDSGVIKFLERVRSRVNVRFVRYL
jgi:hypothetical protein